MGNEELVLNIVAIVVSIAAIIISVVVSLVALRVSNRESRKTAAEYGDVAGTRAAIQYEEEKAAKACFVAFHALLNEIARIRELVGHNGKLEPRSS